MGITRGDRVWELEKGNPQLACGFISSDKKFLSLFSLRSKGVFIEENPQIKK